MGQAPRSGSSTRRICRSAGGLVAGPNLRHNVVDRHVAECAQLALVTIPATSTQSATGVRMGACFRGNGGKHPNGVTGNHIGCTAASLARACVARASKGRSSQRYEIHPTAMQAIVAKATKHAC